MNCRSFSKCFECWTKVKHGVKQDLLRCSNRGETASVMGQHQYQKKQSFTREPFAVHFHSNKTALQDFVLVPLHTSPHQAVQEIDRLYDVFEEVSRKWKTKNVMFLGDFHAGCAHMTRSDRKKIRLFTKRDFFWLISNKVDTTVGDVDCPYDSSVAPACQVLKVSDHFPVEVELKSSARLLQATPLLILLSLCVIMCQSAL
ncbi:deoxyribonuclease-1-like 2 [Diretmus argenteus]